MDELWHGYLCESVTKGRPPAQLIFVGCLGAGTSSSFFNQMSVSLSCLFFIAFFGSQLTFGRELEPCNTATPIKEQAILAADICNMHTHTQRLRILIKDILFIPQIHLPLLESPTALAERLFEESFETSLFQIGFIFSFFFQSKNAHVCIHECTCSFSNKW